MKSVWGKGRQSPRRTGKGSAVGLTIIPLTASAWLPSLILSGCLLVEVSAGVTDPTCEAWIVAYMQVVRRVLP